MDIKDYYMEFLNHELSRDFLSIGRFSKDIASKVVPQKTMQNILNERCKFQNNTFYSISIKRDGVRYSDRLFFDFDLENETYKELQKSSDARDMLFNSTILETPFNEVAMVYDYLSDDGFKPYTVFSASKGMHMYCFFNPCYIENIGIISMKYAETIQNELNLKTLDFAVNKDAHMRKARLPYSRHNKTDLFATPYNVNDDLSDILFDAVNPSIKDFHISDYIMKGFSEVLMDTDKDVSDLLQKKQQRMEKERELERQSNKDVIVYKDIDFSAINMRDLVRDVASDYFVKSMGKYDIYLCPFHSDTNHSAYCYEKIFGCASCGKSWNYYDFLKDYYGLTEKKDIINELKNHLSYMDIRTVNLI